MALFESLAKSWLAAAQITVNGDKSWDIRVHNDQLYSRVFLKGSLGLGEAYMDGWWDCDDIAGFICRILRVKAKRRFIDVSRGMLRLAHRLYNNQSIARSKRVAERHYDLGNDLYEAMLDPRMVYTCGYWKPHTKNLAEAQEHKLELVCQKLYLKPGMRVLDIGCGWGSFARYAAERYGVSVTGVTISKEQIALGQERCRGLDVELKLMDYRNLPAQFPGYFDRVVSLGMFEHVGPKNYGVYMDIARAVLKKNGLFLLHTIGGNGADPWIEKYIFPGGWLPNQIDIIRAIKGRFAPPEDWHNFGAYYDPTLCSWERNFERNWGELKATGKYDERFRRMWRYYLLSCAGAFRARKTQLWQIVLSPEGVPGGYRSVR